MRTTVEIARDLWAILGDIDDLFVQEAMDALPAPIVSRRKRAAKYGAIFAAASVGVGVAYFFLRNKRTA